MTATLVDPLVEHRACQNCQHDVNDQGVSTDISERGWIHTLTSQYRCPPGHWGVTGDSFANPSIGLDAIEAAIEQACAETDTAVREELADTTYDGGQLEDAKAEARHEGRAQYSTELNGAITVALHHFMQSGLTRQERQLIEQLNDALTEAWESVPV